MEKVQIFDADCISKEKIKIFDHDKNEIGMATRDEVHRLGHWHETFHCWFTSVEDGKEYIYFQLRSLTKKDYPNLLDITAAGHILAEETVEDGIREIKEELGIHVVMDDLVPLGVFECSIKIDDYINNEFSHVFLYHRNHDIADFKLQPEEVRGIMKSKFASFYDLWMGLKEEIHIEGYIINENGEKVMVNQTVGKEAFTPNINSYYEKLVKRCRSFFNNGGIEHGK